MNYRVNWLFLPRSTRVKLLKMRRGILESELRRCEKQHTRDKFTLQIELINIHLQNIGERVYKQHKGTF